MLLEYQRIPNVTFLLGVGGIVMGTGTWVVFVYAQMPVPSMLQTK